MGDILQNIYNEQFCRKLQSVFFSEKRWSEIFSSVFFMLIFIIFAAEYGKIEVGLDNFALVFEP